MVRGSCVCIEGRGLLIVGPSGSGKSGVALELMAYGAALVSDDRTRLTRPDAGAPVAEPVAAIAGLIEARGIGLLRARLAPPCRLAAVVDLEIPECHRLPPERHRRVLGVDLPLLHKVESPHFVPALLQYVKCTAR